MKNKQVIQNGMNKFYGEKNYKRDIVKTKTAKILLNMATLKNGKFFKSLAFMRKGHPGFFWRNEHLMSLAKRGHPAATALALMGQPLPRTRTGHPESFLNRGQPSILALAD
jgi:hypothetical protein